MRSGQLSAEKGSKFHNDLAGYPRQPPMPDKIPARGWKSQGKYPPRTTLPRTRHTSGRNDLHLGIIYQTVSIDYDRLFFGNMSFVHDIRRAELIASLVHDIRREEMICIDYLFERSEFLIDTPNKKKYARLPLCRVHVSNNLGFSVYVRKYHIRTFISSLSAGYQDTYMYLRMCQGGVRIMCHICS